MVRCSTVDAVTSELVRIYWAFGHFVALRVRRRHAATAVVESTGGWWWLLLLLVVVVAIVGGTSFAKTLDTSRAAGGRRLHDRKNCSTGGLPGAIRGVWNGLLAASHATLCALVHERHTLRTPRDGIATAAALLHTVAR